MKVIAVTQILNDPAARMVLECLTWRVRVMTSVHFNRIVDARFNENRTSLLPRLVAARLVHSATAAVTYHEAFAPMYSWSPGLPKPSFNAIAWRLAKRWQDARSRRLTLYWATEVAARLCAGTSRYSQHRSQVEHDLGVASVLVRLHETDPEAADHWLGEDILRRGHELDRRLLAKIPDAAIVQDALAVKFVEFGGQYPADRVRRFHDHCRLRNIPYELW